MTHLPGIPDNSKLVQWLRGALEGAGAGTIRLTVEGWPGFCLGGLSPVLRMDDQSLTPTGCRVQQDKPGGALRLEYAFSNRAALYIDVEACGDIGLRLQTHLRYEGDATRTLNEVQLLGVASAGGAAFGSDPRAVRVMEQHGPYTARVRGLVEQHETADGNGKGVGEPNETAVRAGESSDLTWLAYDRASQNAMLVGFISSQRWLGRIKTAVDGDGRILLWRVGLDGGDVLVEPDTTTPLEDFVMLTGRDPLRLLDDYADVVRDRFDPVFPSRPPVSWCSWYPYRLGVTEERVLAEARVAAERLGPLGLKIIEVDLGWQRDNLPSAFEENDRFPHGLRWLADQLEAMGFDLGAWCAPYTISVWDSLATVHPEYLVQDDAGQPAACGQWFWPPHGQTHLLDLTHRGAQRWLKEKITSLAQRGVRYLKADFLSIASQALARRRHDRRIASGDAVEAARLGAAIVRDAMPDALILNCGGPSMPGAGQWPLLYACNDTGNTGFISHRLQQSNHLSLACHLYQNGRWGVIQPSCLCVGLPGTVEDARLRATIAFLAGGQIDISDALTTLPEDRWSILTATLPPLGRTARPIDLFEPLVSPRFDYERTCGGDESEETPSRELPAGSVWHVHVTTAWDEWELVGFFNYDQGSSAETSSMTRFVVPLERLGISDGQQRWGYEFWGGHFLGTVPARRRNMGGYEHPGDYQDLASGDKPDLLDISFFGPGVKLVCLRRARRHPWVVGTSFHQSCGSELTEVAWDPASGLLHGEVRRPPNERGFIALAPAGYRPSRAEVDGKAVRVRHSANGAWLLPISLEEPSAQWSVHFERCETDA